MNFPVFDLHCDTALALLGDNYRNCGSLRTNKTHIDLQRALDALEEKDKAIIILKYFGYENCVGSV